MTFTAQDVLAGYKALEHNYLGEFGYGFTLPDLGEFEGVSDYERDLDNPSEIYGVVKHVESGRHFKVTGFYDSWNGTDWDEGDIYEVKQVTKTYTVWE